MALTINLHQRALHDASRDAMFDLKYQSWQSSAGLTSTLHIRAAQTKAEEPVIPAPQAFQSLSHSPIQNTNGVPTIGECAAHLELLQSFHMLRVKVLQSRDLDTTFGIKPINRTVFRKGRRGKRGKAVKLRDDTFTSRRREKWPFFLGLAAERFRIWLKEADVDLIARDPHTGSSSHAAVVARSIPFLPPLGLLKSLRK
jgi:hypothetical protein